MNAQVGLTNLLYYWSRRLSLNLHKTFAILGGGGPGVGPICVGTKISTILGNPLVSWRRPSNYSNFWRTGSALVCLISYGYICMLGAEELRMHMQFKCQLYESD
jgi:glycine dehydrogenase